MRTAIAYVTDTLICPSKGASPAAEQEACIRAYAAANGIEIVKVVRDELCTPHPLGRPGMMDVMLAGPEVATVLVDTVQAVAPRWSDIQTVIRELKRRGLRLECATMRFDLASQMARRAFDPERFVPDVVRRLREVKHARPKVRVVKPNGYPTLSPRPHAV
ncbi:MAG: recombinase family protein [Deltaproteobacteria bacterium]|nr:recombinase family protein [Deltaproteobacteria bacterium]